MALYSGLGNTDGMGRHGLAIYFQGLGNTAQGTRKPGIGTFFKSRNIQGSGSHGLANYFQSAVTQGTRSQGLALTQLANRTGITQPRIGISFLTTQ